MYTFLPYFKFQVDLKEFTNVRNIRSIQTDPDPAGIASDLAVVFDIRIKQLATTDLVNLFANHRFSSFKKANVRNALN